LRATVIARLVVTENPPLLDAAKALDEKLDALIAKAIA
jgi:hypothetical protein